MSTKITTEARNIRTTFKAYKSATEAVMGKAAEFITAVASAVLSGYVVDGTEADVLGLLGGRDNPGTAPLRTRLIGKNGTVALLTEWLTAHEDADMELLAMESPEAITVLASYFHGNVKVGDARIALGLPTPDRTETATESSATEDSTAPDAPEPVSGAMSNGDAVKAFRAMIRDLRVRDLTAKQTEVVLADMVGLADALARVSGQAPTPVGGKVKVVRKAKAAA